MSTEVVDIHPHVISTDTLRYPRAPIGGHRSAWSRDRPVSVEQMIVEQDLNNGAARNVVQSNIIVRTVQIGIVDAFSGGGNVITGNTISHRVRSTPKLPIVSTMNGKHDRMRLSAPFDEAFCEGTAECK